MRTTRFPSPFLEKVSYVKAIDWFLLVCLVFVFAALIEFAIVAYSHDKMTKKMLQMKKMRSVSRSDNEDDVASAESEQVKYNVNFRVLSFNVPERQSYNTLTLFGLIPPSPDGFC